MPWEGIKFDDTGQNILGKGITVQVIGGKYTTVWPFNLVAKNVVVSFPAWNKR